MNRTEERKTAYKIIFSFPFNSGKPVSELLENYSESNEIELSDYIRDTVNGVSSHLDEIDKKIKSCIKNRKFERLDNVCIAAMRLAAYEIIYNDDIPTSVAINEAIEITKEFDDSLAGFVHGNLSIISGLKNE